MNEQFSADPSLDVLHRMLDDARALTRLEGDAVLGPRGAYLVAYLTETLALKRPQ